MQFLAALMNKFAVARHTAKKTMPTALSTKQLRAVDKNVRARSFFSARNLLTESLDGAAQRITSIIAPTVERDPARVTDTNPEGLVTRGMDIATARMELKQLFGELGYEPDPEKRGTLEDLSSDARIELVLKTNRDLAFGWSLKQQGLDPGALEAFPAWELYRLESRQKERNWPQRWVQAGAASGSDVLDGWIDSPMIALKGHPIWEQLGNSSLFPDALDTDYPPFAFNSGMWVEDVDYRRAIGLGILQPGARPERPPEEDLFEIDEEVFA